jgi:archaellum component FlaC
MSDYIEHYELECIKKQLYTIEDTMRNLTDTIEKLQMENTLLSNDLNTLKTEGCWHFIKNPEHNHE